MTTRVEPDEIEISRSEKLLAFVLAVFILIGGLWGYFKLDEVAQPERPRAAFSELTPAQQRALNAHRESRVALSREIRQRRGAVRRLELRREAYRTALDAGEAAPELRAAYLEASEELNVAEDRVAAQRERVEQLAPAAREAEAELSRIRQEARDRDELVLLGLRLLLVLSMLGGAYLLLSALRARRSRYLPAAMAWIAAAALLALVMAADYTSDLIDVTEVGPLALSIAGITLTLLALVALQRYLARRLPRRRVRRSECPFCGFPFRGGEHCEGCGRRVVAQCAACHSPRRVGAPHCAACGAE